MKWVSKRDIIAIAALLIAALLLLYLRNGSEGTGYELLADGEIILSGSLAKDGVLELEEYPQVKLEVRGGRIAFIKSDCTDRTCIHTGFISNPGQIAACLPNGLILRITGKSEVDAYV